MTPNAEYELLLLGSLTHYGATVAKPILDVMVSEHFADPMARQLFGVLKYATSNGLPLGEVEVYEYAKELGVMIEVDKLCVMPVVAKSDLDAHMLHLQDLASRRALKRAAAELAAETGLTADEIIDKYSGRLAQFRSVGLRGSRTMAEIIREMAARTDPEPTIVLPVLDEPVEAGTMTVIAGATGMGKTTYALQAALSIAARGKTVKFASLEMAGSELALRVPMLNPNGDCLDRVHIQDEMGSALAPLVGMCKRWVLQGADALVLDHLQMVTAGRERFASRREMIGEAALRFKHLARETHVPLLMLCQIARLERGRAGNRPDMSDLKESGDIENHADRVVLLWRPDYYRKDGSPEVTLAKNRHGRTGFAEAGWDTRSGMWLPAALPGGVGFEGD